MKGEHQIQMGKMLLFAAAVVVSVASVSGANSESQHVQRYVANGKMVPQNVMEQAQAAALSAMAGQPTADDRSLLLTKAVIKGIALKKLKKKKKKNPFKSPLKSLHLLPFLGIGGAAAAAAAAGTAAGTAAKGGVSPLLPPATYTALPENFAMPAWKVHKYNGIEIRPVRYSDLPLPPPSEADFPQVIGNVPKEVNVPEPVIDTFPTPADTITFPETPKDIPTTYGLPAQTYGPPAPVYGVPASVYGVPASTYGAPNPTYSAPSQSYYVPPQGFQASSGSEAPTQVTEEGATDEGLEALSNLGALTDFLPGGGDASGSLFGGQNRGIAPLSFFSRFIRGPQSASQTFEVPATTTVFRQPSQSAIQNLLGRIPIISSLTNFGSNPSTHLSIPPLPELPAVPDIQNVRAPIVASIPQIPHIRLPTKYVIRGSSYNTIRVPPHLSQPTPVIETINTSPPEVPVETVVESVKPEQPYSLPLEQPQPQSPFVVNSYGQPIQPVQTGYYVTPVIAGPAAQYGMPIYPASLSGKPAAVYGLPGGDSIVAASEMDTATSTECAEGKSCRQGVIKVAVPEGKSTKEVTRSQSVSAPRPVYKKEETLETKEATVENLARYLDPEHASAINTPSDSPEADDVDDDVDAKPSTAAS